MLEAHTVYAKCLNPECSVKTFALRPQGISKYQKATDRFKKDVILSNVLENVPCEKISDKLPRSLNTTASRPTIDRWKHKEADKYAVGQIVAELGHCGILCLDDVHPKREKNTCLTVCNQEPARVLYLDTIEDRSEESVEKFLNKFKSYSKNDPWCWIIDMEHSFVPAIKKVYGDEILIQYDYYHVMRDVYEQLKKAIRDYAEELIDDGFEVLAKKVWRYWGLILKRPHHLSEEEKQKFKAFMEIYGNSILSEIIVFKERIHEIFDQSKTVQEAYDRRNQLYFEEWWKKSKRFRKITEFLMHKHFEYMITFIKNPQVPRAGKSEPLTRLYRQWEKVRYGFRTHKGRLDHLKLYQITKYFSCG